MSRAPRPRHTWQFKARFRRNASGWRGTRPAIARIDEAASPTDRIKSANSSFFTDAGLHEQDQRARHKLVLQTQLGHALREDARFDEVKLQIVGAVPAQPSIVGRTKTPRSPRGDRRLVRRSDAAASHPLRRRARRGRTAMRRAPMLPNRSVTAHACSRRVGSGHRALGGMSGGRRARRLLVRHAATWHDSMEPATPWTAGTPRTKWMPRQEERP